MTARRGGEPMWAAKRRRPGGAARLLEDGRDKASPYRFEVGVGVDGGVDVTAEEFNFVDHSGIPSPGVTWSTPLVLPVASRSSRSRRRPGRDATVRCRSERRALGRSRRRSGRSRPPAAGRPAGIVESRHGTATRSVSACRRPRQRRLRPGRPRSRGRRQPLAAGSGAGPRIGDDGARRWWRCRATTAGRSRSPVVTNPSAEGNDESFGHHVVHVVGPARRHVAMNCSGVAVERSADRCGSCNDAVTRLASVRRVTDHLLRSAPRPPSRYLSPAAARGEVLKPSHKVNKVAAWRRSVCRR